MAEFLITKGSPGSAATLKAIAYLATEHLPQIVDPSFFHALEEKHFMRIATFLAQKSYDEGGCPIGGVIIDSETRQIIGKGHNTLGQENDSTTHGETAAIRDAGRVAQLKGAGPVDFRKSTLFTTLTPCAVCCAQINHRGHFEKVVIGDITNAPTTEPLLRAGGTHNIVILEDARAIDLYKTYAQKRPDLHYIDWGGHKKLAEMLDKN